MNDSLQSVHCEKNNITVIPVLGKNLEIMDCSDNAIVSLPPMNTEKEVKIKCDGNPIYDILIPPEYNNEKMHIDLMFEGRHDKKIYEFLIENNNKLIAFRHLYWCVRLRDKFSVWAGRMASKAGSL
jgi:Leucine-rich repeat (LRR) protein